MKHQVDLTQFVRAVSATNPFSRDRVTQTNEGEADVQTIHKREFGKLVRRINDVRDSGDSSGVLLLGAPGVGKSHILARLFRWAEADGKAMVVYLHNLLASPERIGRYVLHATVSSLAGNRPSDFAESRLYEIINRAIGARLKKQKGRGAPSLSVRREILTEIGHEIDPEQMVMPVFIAFLEQAVGANLAQLDAEARALAAIHWLGGETIDTSVAESIGLRVNSEEGACIEDDVAVQRTLDVLCRLCACAGWPFVLCLDQVDNLDHDKVTALAGFLHASIDNGHNLVVVLSGVEQTMLSLEEQLIIPPAAMDRLGQHRIALKRISPADAQRIVAERVKRFAEPFKDLKEVAERRKKDELVPLSSVWWERRLGAAIEVRPRDAIRWAREEWERQQDEIADVGADDWIKQLAKKPKGDKSSTPPPDPVELPPIGDAIASVVEKKLAEALTERKLHPERLPPDGDNLAALTVALLEHCVLPDKYTLRSARLVVAKGKALTYDMVATEQSQQGAEISNGLSFLTADNALKATHALNRMAKDQDPPTHQLLVTDEERRPLRLGARGQQHFDALGQSGRFAHIQLRFEDCAALDALSTVLGAARVGDLDVKHAPDEYRPITESECAEALHRLGAFVDHPLLHELLTEEPKPSTEPKKPDRSTADQIRHHITGQLLWRLSLTAREMAQIVVDLSGQPQENTETIWRLVKEVAAQMHAEKSLYAQAVDDDLFLQLRSGIQL